jgi:hypothetical protein
METFDFFLDTKVTTWYRTPFEIEANTLEEAQKLAIKFVKDGEHETKCWEEIEDVIQNMSVKENQGKATQELRTEDFDTIWDNTQE